MKSAIYSFSHIQTRQIWSASALYVWKTHELSAGCAVSHARPSAASFLKVQLLIRSVLLLIVQGPGWPCLPETISGFCVLFFWKSGWSCNMIQISWSLRTMSHRSRQTGIAKGISLVLPYMHNRCASTKTLLFSFLSVLSNAHIDKYVGVFCSALLLTHSPAHTSYLFWPSVSLPAVLPMWQRSRQNISVRGSDAESEWQSDREKCAKQTASKIALSFH